ncbi:phage terminase large subunit [Mesorhizobium sp. GR13]|uniref:phage terminase large subunit n=1 Tax=Mesorhizobium sp. GR13 TaxID=2562308 RepID=UPI001485C18A|nr:phage terminase large subunit [Mesorhizobium sp. GR13]
MNHESRKALDIILRRDFESFFIRVFQHLNPGTQFLGNWHSKAVAYHLDLIRNETIRRLIIAMPPRSGKSIAASVALPAFVHGHDPRRRIVCASYSQELATKFQNDYRRVLTSDWYRHLFPATRISSRKDTEAHIELNEGGSRTATSVGGTLTGLGADLIIIDDPLKAADAASEPARQKVNQWYGSTLLSRLNDKNSGAIVIASQRLHVGDLVGHVRAAGVHWETLTLQAIATRDQTILVGDNLRYIHRKGELLHPAREPQSILDNLLRELGELKFGAQYLQEPVAPGGNMFRHEWLRRYDLPIGPQSGDKIIQSWDTASKIAVTNDWSVCVTVLERRGEFYLIDVFRKRVDFPRLRQAAIELARKHSPRLVLVEDAGVGPALIADLRQAGVSARAMKCSKSKEARADVQTAKFEGGRVLLPNKAPWLAELEAELLAFPGGQHDDQVDALCQALAYERPRMKSITLPIRIGYA